ncbi:MAG TPA: antibiotic biosynthesis monooxygenase [Chloroflexota bacterium]|nr:antibiotic biosynthesis monooxygenase [Chloroflexota bacterium]
MIVELAIIRAKAGQADVMRQGLQAARTVIAQAEGHRGSVFHQGIEDPQRFVLRIEWDSVEAHMSGFRNGPLFPEWRSHFGQYIEGAPDVSHFEVIAGP